MKIFSHRIWELATVSLITAILASLGTDWLLTAGPQTRQTAPAATEATATETFQTAILATAASALTTTATSQATAPQTTPETDGQTTATTADPDIIGDQAKEQLAMLTDGRLVETLYDRIAPSVVGIEIETRSETSATLLYDQGSGVISSADGQILTSAALFQIALDHTGRLLPDTRILVRVRDARQLFPASLTGLDTATGVAVLSIDPGNTRLAPAKFETAQAPRVGQLVFFASYPDDMVSEGCLTSGLVTALHQPVQLEDGTTVTMLRSSAPILASGQGGPLLNLAGEVIALATTSQLTETFESLSYAVEASTVLPVARRLLSQDESAAQPWLGIAVLRDESYAELKKLYGLPDGLYVSHVMADSPAYLANIRLGDTITAVNGEAIRQHQSLASILSTHQAGDQLILTIYRRQDNNTTDVKVYLKETHD